MKIIQPFFPLILFLLLTSNPVSSQPWEARHGLTPAQYQTEFNKWASLGYRLTDVSGYSAGGGAYYAAIWEKSAGPAWEARHGMTAAQYQTDFDAHIKSGFRLKHISAFGLGAQAFYSAIWEKSAGPAWEAKHGLTASQYQTEFTKQTGLGYKLTDLSAYNVNGQIYYAAIFEKNNGVAWEARHGLTAAQYQVEFNKWTGQGYRLKRVSGCDAGGQDVYAAIWEKTSGPGWTAVHGLTAAAYQGEFANQVYQGYKLKSIDGYNLSSEARYAAIWETSGMNGEDLSKLDAIAKAYMDKHKVPGLSVAIAKSGNLVYAKGFGYANTSTGEKVNPTHLFRIASVSKPITSIAIMKLMEQGKLKLSDRIFGAGGILGTDFGTPPYKPNVDKITVQNLLEHTSGWSNTGGDPMFMNPGFSKAQVVSWMLNNRALANAPGTHEEYLNFGFCVLGRVIEKLTGQSYETYLKSAILNQTGSGDMQIAGDTEAERKPNEVTYYASNPAEPYGMKVSRMDSHGGWIATPIDLTRILVRVDKFPTKPDILQANTLNIMTTPSTVNAGYAKGWSVNNANNYWHNGSLPGTLAIMVRTQSGFCWAAMVNTRENQDFYAADLDKLMWDLVNSVSKWPNYDLF